MLNIIKLSNFLIYQHHFQDSTDSEDEIPLAVIQSNIEAKKRRVANNTSNFEKCVSIFM